MPHENGSVTPSTPAAATAASTALPPAFSASMAARVPRASTVAAAPPVPVAVACAPAWDAGARTRAARTATNRRMGQRYPVGRRR